MAKHTKPFKRQSHKMVKHTQTIRRQIADESFECVWPFCEIGAKRDKDITDSVFKPLISHNNENNRLIRWTS